MRHACCAERAASLSSDFHLKDGEVIDRLSVGARMVVDPVPVVRISLRAALRMAIVRRENRITKEAV